jgi:hypothetical protein
MIDETQFFAWLDGELPDDQATEVERKVAGDPELQRKVAEHRALAAGLRSAFAPVVEAPLPSRLTELLASPPESTVVSLAEAREDRKARSGLTQWKQIAAMAATLALGIVVGSQLAEDASSPIQAEAGRLVAGADLESALYSQLASAPADEGPRIGITFRDRSGAFCRTFEDQGSAGLACREGAAWRIRALFQGPEGQSADYRMATGVDPRLMELVDATIKGEPLDAAQERAALKRGWR